jgi:hypothetical protein
MGDYVGGPPPGWDPFQTGFRYTSETLQQPHVGVEYVFHTDCSAQDVLAKLAAEYGFTEQMTPYTWRENVPGTREYLIGGTVPSETIFGKELAAEASARVHDVPGRGTFVAVNLEVKTRPLPSDDGVAEALKPRVVKLAEEMQQVLTKPTTERSARRGLFRSLG